MRRLPVFLFFSCIGLHTVAGLGEDSCKSYTKWDEKYARKVLADSPWSKPFVLAKVHSQTERYDREDSIRAPGERGDDGLTEKRRTWGIDRGHGISGEKEIYNAYTLRLFSALPVRQAFVRMFQIINHYEKMPAGQKQQLDQKFAEALSMDMNDRIVVTVSFTATDEELHREIDRQLHQATAESLKTRAYLISDSAGRVPLKDYYPASSDGAGAKIVFPRFVNGQPLVSASDEELGFEFTVPGPEQKIFVIWNIKDLMCEGEMLL